MTDPYLAKIRSLTEILDPAAFRARVKELRRGGLPGQSSPEGSRSAETPMPQLDRDDVEFHAALVEYGHCLEDAHTRLIRAVELETGYMPDRHMTGRQWEEHREDLKRATAELISKRAKDCANPNCQRPVERTANDPMIEGRCHLCWQYRKRHDGKERPRVLCVKDTERQFTRLAETGT